jgi:hypothetical protein
MALWQGVHRRLDGGGWWVGKHTVPLLHAALCFLLQRSLLGWWWVAGGINPRACMQCYVCFIDEIAELLVEFRRQIKQCMHAALCHNSFCYTIAFVVTQ